MEIGAIILAGGKSTRFGEDKGLVEYLGKPLVQYSIDVVDGFCKELTLVSSNKEYSSLGVKRVEDELPALGPLGGIQAGLRKSKCEWNVVLSSDIPNIDSFIIESLLQRPINELIRVSRCDNRSHPLVGVYSKWILPELDKFLLSGGRSVLDFIKNFDCNYIDFEDAYSSCFANVNTMDDLKELSR